MIQYQKQGRRLFFLSLQKFPAFGIIQTNLSTLVVFHFCVRIYLYKDMHYKCLAHFLNMFSFNFNFLTHRFGIETH